MRRAAAIAEEGSAARAAADRTAVAAVIPAAVGGTTDRDKFVSAKLRTNRAVGTKDGQSAVPEVSDVDNIIELAGYRLAYMVCSMSLVQPTRLWYLFPNHPA